MSGYICKCGHEKNYHAAPATGGMYDGTGYGKCSIEVCNCEGFTKKETETTKSFRPLSFEEVWIKTQDKIRNLDKRLSILENQNCANQIKDILGELYSWAFEYEKDIIRYSSATSTEAGIVAEFRGKIAGIQKRYGIGT